MRAVEALPVLPWGFGKWLGICGPLIAEEIATARPGELFLGDNSGRPAMSPRPRLFARAEARGLAVLPGSDPLPFAGGREGRALWLRARGAVRCGGAVRRDWRALTGLSASPEPFGRLERWSTFVHRQIAMQLGKRRRARP